MIVIHGHIMDLSVGKLMDSQENDWIKDVTFNLGTCNSKVKEHLVFVKDE